MGVVIVATHLNTAVPEFAGSTWVRLQYVLGFQKLGWETYWFDRLNPIDPIETRRDLDYLLARFAWVASLYGFDGHYCIVYNDGERFLGLDEREYHRVSARADILVSVSESPPPGSPLLEIPVRAYVDVDPGFTQVWAEQYPEDMGLNRHTHHFTVGQNVGTPAFQLPTGDFEWHPMVPPVDLDAWPPAIDGRCRRFTTVADWRGSQHLEYHGIELGGKREQFQNVLDLPRLVKQEYELALCIGPGDHADVRTLLEHGWGLVDPYRYAGDPLAYRSYIRSSRGEFSVAKHGYVVSRSGWVSDRTACYLSSGKPVVVESTGLENHLPTGSGLMTFETLEEAADATERINGEYQRHCLAAREIAEEHFSSERVLGALLSTVGI